MVSLTGDSQGSQNHRHKTEGQSPRARGEGNAELECNGDSFHFERKLLEMMVRQCLMSLNCEINQNGSGENQGVGNTTLWERVGGRCDEGPTGSITEHFLLTSHLSLKAVGMGPPTQHTLNKPRQMQVCGGQDAGVLWTVKMLLAMLVFFIRVPGCPAQLCFQVHLTHGSCTSWEAADQGLESLPPI